MNHNTCPITGDTLPHGYTIHPALIPQLQEWIKESVELLGTAFEDLINRSNGEPTASNKGGSFLKFAVLEDLHFIEERFKEISNTLGMPSIESLLTNTQAHRFCRHNHAVEWFYVIKHNHRMLAEPYQPKLQKLIVKCLACGDCQLTPVGLDAYQCKTCGAAQSVRASRMNMYQLALTKLMTKRNALKAVKLLTGVEVTERQLDAWRRKGWLRAYGPKKQCGYVPAEILAAYRRNNRSIPRVSRTCG